jgi:hypothetical protein
VALVNDLVSGTKTAEGLLGELGDIVGRASLKSITDCFQYFGEGEMRLWRFHSTNTASLSRALHEMGQQIQHLQRFLSRITRIEKPHLEILGVHAGGGIAQHLLENGEVGSVTDGDGVGGSLGLEGLDVSKNTLHALSPSGKNGLVFILRKIIDELSRNFVLSS